MSTLFTVSDDPFGFNIHDQQSLDRNWQELASKNVGEDLGKK